MDINLLREFGFPVALVVVFMGMMSWIVKTYTVHFMDAIKRANDRADEMTRQFTTVVENHISHSTEAINNMCAEMKEMRGDHKEFVTLLGRFDRHSGTTQ